MLTHLKGLLLLAVCGALLGLETLLFMSGQWSEMFWTMGIFAGAVAVLGMLLALFPSLLIVFAPASVRSLIRRADEHV